MTTPSLNIEKIKLRKCKTCNLAVNHLNTTRLCTPCGVQMQELKRKKNGTQKTGKKSQKKPKPKYKREKTLKKKCWALWSKKIRSEASDWQGYVECYTCLDYKPMEEMHAGHFIHGKLDFDERNIKPCCIKCNMYLSGNLGNYAERLIRENGLEWLEQLRNDAGKHTGYKEEELKELYAQLTLDKGTPVR